MPLDVVSSAVPDDDEGLLVVLMVALSGLATDDAGLPLGEGAAGCQAGEDALSIGGVVCVLLASLSLDPVGVALVEGADEPGLMDGTPWLAEVAAPPGAVPTGSLGWLELGAAVSAGSHGPTIPPWRPVT